MLGMRVRDIRLAVAAAAVALLLVPVAGAEAKRAAADFSLGGVPCRTIAVPAAGPVGVGACPGVRPGAIVNSPKGQCTLNFLFTGSDGRRYIGTAGHCILGEGISGGQNAGEAAWGPGVGPAATDSAGNRIGEFAYAVLQDPRDFALIRLDPGVAASPQMCVFGGPNGTNNDLGGDLVALQHYGNGVGLGSTVPARTHIAVGMPDPNRVYATGLAISGDSGAGVISSDGRAVGVLVTVGLHFGTGHGGLIGITRIAPQRARAAQVLGVGLTMQTAALLP